MAYFYVKSTLGTRTTGGGLTKQTGSFTTLGAASVYANIANAITDGATSGDFICVSDAHAHTQATTITYTGPTGGDQLYIVTVDDANCDQTAATPASPQETCTASGNDIVFSGGFYVKNLYFDTEDNITWAGNNNSYLDGCRIYLEDVMTQIVDGTAVTFIGCTIDWADTTSAIQPSSGAFWEFVGCTFTNIGSGKLTEAAFSNGGGAIILRDCDITSCTGNIFNNIGGSKADDDTVRIEASGCKINASATLVEEDFTKQGHRAIITNTASTSAAAEYQYYNQGMHGAAEDDTSIYRDNSTAFPSGQKISLKVVTSSVANAGAPFAFDVPTRYAELSNAASDNIKLYILSSATLYDSDIWAEVVYPDGTNAHEYNYLSTRHTEILDTNGTELSTNTESWTGMGSPLENKYEINLDTSADAGSDCVPIIRLYVAKASTTLYVCPTLELS